MDQFQQELDQVAQRFLKARARRRERRSSFERNQLETREVDMRSLDQSGTQYSRTARLQGLEDRNETQNQTCWNEENTTWIEKYPFLNNHDLSWTEENNSNLNEEMPWWTEECNSLSQENLSCKERSSWEEEYQRVCQSRNQSYFCLNEENPLLTEESNYWNQRNPSRTEETCFWNDANSSFNRGNHSRTEGIISCDEEYQRYQLRNQAFFGLNEEVPSLTEESNPWNQENPSRLEESSSWNDENVACDPSFGEEPGEDPAEEEEDASWRSFLLLREGDEKFSVDDVEKPFAHVNATSRDRADDDDFTEKHETEKMGKKIGLMTSLSSSTHRLRRFSVRAPRPSTSRYDVTRADDEPTMTQGSSDDVNRRRERRVGPEWSPSPPIRHYRS